MPCKNRHACWELCPVCRLSRPNRSNILGSNYISHQITSRDHLPKVQSAVIVTENKLSQQHMKILESPCREEKLICYSTSHKYSKKVNRI